MLLTYNISGNFGSFIKQFETLSINIINLSSMQNVEFQHVETSCSNFNKLVLGIQKSSELFFVKFNLYLKTNEKILISEIFSVCINDLLPSFGELANSLTIETHRLRSDKVINAFSYLF